MQKPSNLIALALFLADWWAQQLVADQPKDSGDTKSSAAINRLLASERYNVSTKERHDFEGLLAGWIVGRFAGDAAPSRVVLSTDYGPEAFLAEAADAAGIDHLVFPFKTYTYLDNEGVWVKAGYGAGHRLLLPAEYDPTPQAAA